MFNTNSTQNKQQGRSNRHKANHNIQNTTTTQNTPKQQETNNKQKQT